MRVHVYLLIVDDWGQVCMVRTWLECGWVFFSQKKKQQCDICWTMHFMFVPPGGMAYGYINCE